MSIFFKRPKTIEHTIAAVQKLYNRNDFHLVWLMALTGYVFHEDLIRILNLL